jgi:hypothetical protein
MYTQFWIFFRKYLVFFAIFEFTLAFLVPFFSFDKAGMFIIQYITDKNFDYIKKIIIFVDGFIFSGGMLSLVNGCLVLVSFLHIIPWRRHPAPLLLQISITSILFSIIIGTSMVIN